MATDPDFLDRLRELRARVAEYEAATADMDMDTGAGYFRWDEAHDELIAVLIGDPVTGDAGIIGPMLALLDRHGYGR
jgi:hypothetical protein